MTTDRDLDQHLLAEYRRLFPHMTDFWVGANDEDCLTINFVLDGVDVEHWQTEENMGDSEAENFIFRNVETDEEVTIPFEGD